jgi:hypothetical protein
MSRFAKRQSPLPTIIDQHLRPEMLIGVAHRLADCVEHVSSLLFFHFVQSVFNLPSSIFYHCKSQKNINCVVPIPASDALCYEFRTEPTKQGKRRRNSGKHKAAAAVRNVPPPPLPDRDDDPSDRTSSPSKKAKSTP